MSYLYQEEKNPPVTKSLNLNILEEPSKEATGGVHFSSTFINPVQLSVKGIRQRSGGWSEAPEGERATGKMGVVGAALVPAGAGKR